MLGILLFIIMTYYYYFPYNHYKHYISHIEVLPTCKVLLSFGSAVRSARGFRHAHGCFPCAGAGDSTSSESSSHGDSESELYSDDDEDDEELSAAHAMKHTKTYIRETQYKRDTVSNFPKSN